MPDDILNAAKSDAQKAIDDATKSTGVTPTPSTTDIPIPEPIPVPPAPLAPVTPTVDKPLEPAPDVSIPNPSVADEIAAKEKVVDEILETDVVAPAESPPPPPPESNALKKSAGGKKGTIIAILLLLLMLPVAVYFISLQNEQLAEIRSIATGTVYVTDCSNYADPTCNPDDVICDPQDPNTVCGGENRQCQPGEPNCNNCEGGDCCEAGYYPCGLGSGCCKIGAGGGNQGGGGDDGGGGDNPTPTPTPGNVPQCNLVKVYKGDAVVSDLSTLSVGDQIVIAVAGSHASKGRIRLNGGAFTEIPTPTNGEYQLSHTILAEEIVNNKITIEAEIFGTDGNWH